jgi:hypothetical protein
MNRKSSQRRRPNLSARAGNAGPNGEMDWMVGLSDDEIIKYEYELHEPVDTILLGRKMTDGFISY